MKKICLVLTALYFLLSCNNQEMTREEKVAMYYGAFNTSDYIQIKDLIDDSITVVAGDFIMPYNQESYYEKFKWDSIFLPTYKLTKVTNKNEEIIATVELSSLRNKFLKNKLMTCGYKISFNNDKISKIEELDCPDADWSTWQLEVNTLVNWIKSNHPELDGFINDLTMKGAKNYLIAIELYENRNKDL